MDFKDIDNEYQIEGLYSNTKETTCQLCGFTFVYEADLDSIDIFCPECRTLLKGTDNDNY